MRACPLQATSSRQVSLTPWVSISPRGYGGWWLCLTQRACRIHQRLVNRINGRRNRITASGVLGACACLAAGDAHCRFSGQGCSIWPTQHIAFSGIHFQDQSLGISLEVEISDLSCLKIWQLWAHRLPVSNQLGWEDAASLGWACAFWPQWHRCQQQYLWNVYCGRQERPPQGGDQQYPHFTDEIVEIEIDDR